MPAVLAEPEVILIENPREVKSGGPSGGGPHDFEPGGNGWGGGDDEFSRRGPSGPSAGMIGIVATLVSITALFATIVIAFITRAQTRAYWHSFPFPSILWLSTGLMLASSATLHYARRAMHQSQKLPYAKWVAGTFLLGLGFLVSQAAGLKTLADQGIYMRGNPHSSLLYIITGAHAVHLLGGLFALFYLMWRVAFTEVPWRTQRNALAVTAVYWHFLDVLWVSLFLFLLLWK